MRASRNLNWRADCVVMHFIRGILILRWYSLFRNQVTKETFSWNVDVGTKAATESTDDREWCLPRRLQQRTASIIELGYFWQIFWFKIEYIKCIYLNWRQIYQYLLIYLFLVLVIYNLLHCPLALILPNKYLLELSDNVKSIKNTLTDQVEVPGGSRILSKTFAFSSELTI